MMPFARVLKRIGGKGGLPENLAGCRIYGLDGNLSGFRVDSLQVGVVRLNVRRIVFRTAEISARRRFGAVLRLSAVGGLPFRIVFVLVAQVLWVAGRIYGLPRFDGVRAGCGGLMAPALYGQNSRRFARYA